MIAPRAFARHIACLLLGASLAVASLSAMAWAGAAAEAEATVAVADLERLAQQIADPQQRDQLLKTLQALIVVAKQDRGSAPLQETSNLFAAQSQGLFFAFGELTQSLGTLGRRVGHGLATIPMRLVELPVRLRDPETFGFAMAIALSAAVLVVMGIVLQRLTSRWQEKLRARARVSEPLPRWRKARLALITVGSAAAPYAALLIISGVLFSALSIGAIPSGLAALTITACLLYRLARAAALVCLDPHTPSARLLPVADSTAQRLWGWVVRLIALAAIYFLMTHALLTVGVAAGLYQVVRGVMIIVVAGVLSAMIWRLTQQAQRPAAVAPEGNRRRLWTGVSATLQGIWPTAAIASVWCATLLAIFSFHQGAAFMVAASLQMAVIIGAAIALLWGGERLFDRAAALNDRVGRYLPGLEARTLRYLKTLRWSIRVLVLVAGLLIILQVWGVGTAWLFTSPLASDLLARLITLLVTAAAVMVAIDLSTAISRRLIEPTPGGVEASKKRKTLVPLTATAIKYGALFAGILIALHQVGVNITPILAGVGILSLAVGFGAQTLVKDIINGLFILVEDSMSVGDVVNIRGTGGLVEAVNLRTIRLRDLQGSVHIIPNSQVEMITNMTKDFSYYVLDVGVAYREDTDEVVAVLREIDAELRADPAFAADMLAPTEILGVDRFLDSAVVVKARLKTKPIQQWSVGREFNRRMKKLFAARGIEIPFPNRTIYWGEPKRGEAAPLPLHIHNPEALAAAAGKGDHQTATRREGNAGAP